ncbi:MAG: CRISPR-associated endonuclease Cas2 [Microgenomates group bacterium]
MVKRISYGKVVESVLDVFAEILISTKWSYLPNPYFALGKSIKYLLKYKKLKKKQISKALHDLKERKIIDIVEEDGKAKISLLEKGQYKVFTRSIKLLLDFKKKKKKWDGRWFMVFFDVPENERIKRDNLRKYLKMLGFYPYQKSVYIFPYECKKEVTLIKKIVEGAKYLKYIIADEIEEEDKIKKFFNL